MIEQKIKYILSDDDIEKLSKHLRKKTTIVFQVGLEKLMDHSIITRLKANYAMDAIIANEFDEESFDEWLSVREKPYYLIYKYVAETVLAGIDIYRVPYDIDFKSDLIISPKKKNYPKVKGVPTVVEYYTEKKIVDLQGTVAYNNLIADVQFQLFYTPEGFIYQKYAPLAWAMSDGTIDRVNIKDLGKVYDVELEDDKIIQEGIDRRQCIYTSLQMPTLKILTAIYPDKTKMELMALGRDFMTFYTDDFKAYINESQTIVDEDDPDYGLKKIVAKIKHDTTHSWLNDSVDLGEGEFSVREYLMEQLTI